MSNVMRKTLSSRLVSPFRAGASARRPLCVVVGIGSALLMGAGLVGCYEPVFREDEARSQYDRFDAVREQRAPQYFFDEYGNRKPNIRGRLLGSES